MAIGAYPGAFSSDRTRLTLEPTLALATRYTNVADVATPIVAFEVPSRTEWELLGGTAPNVKLYTTAGTQISRRSRLIIAARLPGQEIPREVALFPYDPFYSLSIDQQNDAQYQERLRLVIPSGGVSFGEAYRLEIWLRSPDQVDWNQANTYFALDVWELRMAG